MPAGKFIQLAQVIPGFERGIDLRGVGLWECNFVELQLSLTRAEPVCHGPLPETRIEPEAKPGLLRPLHTTRCSKRCDEVTVKARLRVVGDFSRSFHGG